MLWLLLAAIGLFVGTFGALIGVAGGFMLVPILLYLYPDETPAVITSITITVAFFSAVSGSIAYARLRRIDYRSGLLFSISAIPGAIIGAVITQMLSREVFQAVFGVVLLIVAAYIMFRPVRRSTRTVGTADAVRHFTDAGGNHLSYAYNRTLGVTIAFFIGILSGLLGIGGGIMHVPILTQVLTFPVHIATATSQFVVGTSTLAAAVTHAAKGNLAIGFTRAAVLSVGAIIGAQIGAHLSRRVPAALIMRLLAIALAAVAVRLLVDSL